MFDVLIQNATIVDGTGETWFHGGIGVTRDSVTVLRGDTQSYSDSKRIIEASGKVVCPGFIDMHSHSDLSLLTSPQHEVKLKQGVTTEIMGMDGLSYAPSSPANLEMLLIYLKALNGLPPEGVRWSSVKDFLELFDHRVSCYVGYFVPHASIRVEAMGWDARLPTDSEILKMQGLAREGMQQGAFGFSTGLTYPPGAYSDTKELVDICESIKDLGGIYMTHARYSLGDKLLDPFKEAVSIGRQSGVPVHISHYHNPVNGMGQRMANLVDDGRNAGIDVTFDQYPYPAASTLLHSL